MFPLRVRRNRCRGRYARRVLLGLIFFFVLPTGCLNRSKPEEPKQKTILSVPVEPERAASRRSETREEVIGKQAAEQISREVGFVNDPELLTYVDEIGQRVARAAGPSELKFRFYVIDSSEPNAFALPGGYVYLSRGLLVLSNSENELANIIAHEVAHIVGHHASNRLERVSEVNLLATLGIIAAAALGGGDAIGAVQASGAAAIAAYTREQERAADSVGQHLALRAGWDPKGMADFLRSLENEARLTQGSTRFTGFFDSHPGTPERVASAAARADAVRGLETFPIAKDRADYLSRIQGLLVGENPAEGIFHDGRFLHPDLGFSLRFPEGWSLRNSYQDVAAIAPQQSAWVRLRLQGFGEDPKEAAYRTLRRAQNVYEKPKSLHVGSLDAYHAVTMEYGQGGVVAVDLTWIAFEGRIYRVEGVVPSVNYRARRNLLRSVGRSFRPLTEEERGLFRAQVLRIVEAAEAETLEALGQRTGNAWSPLETAIANGISRDTILQQGQKMKVVESQLSKPKQ